MLQTTYHVPYLYNSTKTLQTPLKVSVPGSKSITNRALLLGTLAEGTTILRGVLFSDDSRHFLACIKELGFQISIDEVNQIVIIQGLGGSTPLQEATINVGSAGTAARFLTAYLGILKGSYTLDASEQMKKRPMEPLLNCLKELGCEILFIEEENHFPFILKGNGFSKQKINVNIDHSSQFLSALLIASVLSDSEVEISTIGSHGMSYINMTCKMMKQFGVSSNSHANHFTIPADQHYLSLDYQIEPDLSAACYFYALVPLLNIPIQVRNVLPDSMQGDLYFLTILQNMGCELIADNQGMILLPPKTNSFSGIDIDMSSCSDQAITLAAIAPFATSPTTIRGIGHIKYQECNRMQAIVNELRKMEIHCEETIDSITIYPGTPVASTIETYDDHRMAMGFTLTGLRTKGLIIQNPSCCKKTFESFYDVLEEIIDYTKN